MFIQLQLNVKTLLSLHFHAADPKFNAIPVAVGQGFCSTSVGSQIYTKVIRQPQFSYISTAPWWERLELETNCIDVRFGHGLLVQDLSEEMT